MLEVLRSIVQEVTAESEPRVALDIIVNRILAAIDAEVCSVYLADEASDELVLVATKGLRPEAVGRVRLKRQQGVIGLVYDRAEPLNLADASEHSRFHYVKETGEGPFHGFVGVPVILSRRVLGVLVVQRRQRCAFSEDELSMMVTLAAQLAGIIAQIEVEKHLRDLVSGETTENIMLRGTDGTRGVSLGTAVTVRGTRRLRNTPDRKPEDVETEIDRFRWAVAAELAALGDQRERLKDVLSGADLALFDVYALILRGNSLVNEVETRIRAGNWAPGAIRDTISEHARAFEEMDDPYLRGRAADLRDLGERLLRSLQEVTPETAEYPERVVLVGEEISVTDFIEVPSENLAALVSVRGTAASHVGVLARGMGIPAVFGVANLPVSRLDHTEIVVDGYSDQICIQPSHALRAEYVRLEQQERDLSRDLESLRDKTATTTDGVSVALQANTALFADVAAARHAGADGIGLYRSEMHFAIRDRFPGEEEQTAIYRRVIRTFAPRPVSLRTLDIGGDKALPYFYIKEPNPYLGWRGIRVMLDHPELFLTQLRAMLRAGAEQHNYQILFPMVTRLDELDEALELLQRARRELREDGFAAGDPSVGVMVEVPAVVFQVEEYARRVQHLSIGTNDLAQYLLATDRNNERVAHLYDPLHPAVLAAVDRVVGDAERSGCGVSVCGEAAGDPAAALLLLGLGVETLSMGHANLNKVKWVVRSFSRSHAEHLAGRALRFSNPSEVRALMDGELEAAGLGGLVRAGR